jgi:hypothetical protein
MPSRALSSERPRGRASCGLPVDVDGMTVENQLDRRLDGLSRMRRGCEGEFEAAAGLIAKL